MVLFVLYGLIIIIVRVEFLFILRLELVNFFYGFGLEVVGFIMTGACSNCVV